MEKFCCDFFVVLDDCFVARFTFITCRERYCRMVHPACECGKGTSAPTQRTIDNNKLTRVFHFHSLSHTCESTGRVKMSWKNIWKMTLECFFLFHVCRCRHSFLWQRIRATTTLATTTNTLWKFFRFSSPTKNSLSFHAVRDLLSLRVRHCPCLCESERPSKVRFALIAIVTRSFCVCANGNIINAKRSRQNQRQHETKDNRSCVERTQKLLSWLANLNFRFFPVFAFRSHFQVPVRHSTNAHWTNERWIWWKKKNRKSK